MTRRDRIEALEWQRTRRLAAEMGAEHGFSADQVIAEALRFFALPLAEQYEALHIVPAEMAEYDALRARILRGVRR
jgi:hypothetical protein